MTVEIHNVGARILRLRCATDPLNDALLSQPYAQGRMPPTTSALPGLRAEIHEVTGLHARLPLGKPKEALRARAFDAQLIELRLLTADVFRGRFVAGYDYSPLGNILGGLANVPSSTGFDSIRYQEQLQAIPDFLDDALWQHRLQADAGAPPTQGAVRYAISQAEAAAKNPETYAATLPETLGNRVRETHNEILAGAFHRFARGLNTHLASSARGPAEQGLCYTEAGIEVYRALIHVHTGSTLSAAEIHDVGRESVQRLWLEINNALRLTGIDSITKLRVTEPWTTLADQHYKSETDYLKHLQSILAASIRAVRGVGFDVEPPRMEPIPLHQVATAPAAYYLPDLSPAGTGRLRVNFDAWRSAYPWQTEALLHHEAIPGHHFQFAQIDSTQLEDYERAAWFSSTIEGWGLYAEHLAEALGLYSSRDSLVGRLFLELFRAARLVVDTGLHAFGWTSESAAAYLQEHSLLSPAQADAEIERYTEYPAQALSYQMGKLSWINSIGSPSLDTLLASRPILRAGIIPPGALMLAAAAEQ